MQRIFGLDSQSNAVGKTKFQVGLDTGAMATEQGSSTFQLGSGATELNPDFQNRLMTADAVVPAREKPPVHGNHLQQGKIGDCFFVSSLQQVLASPAYGEEHIDKMIQPVQVNQAVQLPNGEVRSQSRTQFKVTFPGFPDQPVMVDPAELDHGDQLRGKTKYKVLERAFAELDRKVNVGGQKDSPTLDPTFEGINGGGSADRAFYAMTGQKSTEISNRQTPQDQYEKQLDGMIKKVQKDPRRYMIVASTLGRTSDDKFLDPERRFPGSHAMAMEVDPHSKDIYIINPWDTERKRYPVSQGELKEYFRRFYVVDTQAAHSNTQAA